MTTKFKDVAHLYLGCKIKTEEGVGTLNELSNDEECEQPINCYDLVHAFLSYDEVRPILRPLSDMTEEESAECDKYGNMGWNLVAKGEPISAVTEISKIGLGIIHRQASETAFLLSRGFDLFGLIESGEAISAASPTAAANIEAGQSTIV
jgi:hypothetical protein